MFRTPSKTDQAKDAVATGAEKVSDGAQVAADKAAELKVKAGEAASATAGGPPPQGEGRRRRRGRQGDRRDDHGERAGRRGDDRAEGRARPRDLRRRRPAEDGGGIATIAAGAAAAKDTAGEAADRAPDAYAVLKGDAVVKRGGKGKWILLLGALAAGAAVMAWRKSNERPDPWATAGPYTPPKSTSEKVSDLAGAAKEKAVEVKDVAAEKVTELKDKATDVTTTTTTKAAAAKATAARRAAEAKTTAAEKAAEAEETAAAAADDLADTAEGAGDETAIPSISETSEGADLSTKNLDTGSSRQGLTASNPARHDAGCPTKGGRRRRLWAAASVFRWSARGRTRTAGRRSRGRPRGGPHLVRSSTAGRRAAAPARHRPGERLEQGVVAGAVAADHGGGHRQHRGQHRRAVEHDVDDEAALGGDPLQPHDQPRWEVERALVEPRLEEQVGARFKGAISRTSATSASSGRSTGMPCRATASRLTFSA